MLVVYGTAHTIGALTVERAGSHAGAWLRREMWAGDLSDMSPAMSAYWLSVNSFGPPVALLGLTVLWLEHRDFAIPSFVAWALGGWGAFGLYAAGPGAGQDIILLAACALLIAGARRGQIAVAA